MKVLQVVFILGVLFCSCKGKEANNDTKAIIETNQQFPPKIDNNFFYKLKLSKADYKFLDSAKEQQLVFQFYYPISHDQTPTLAAYAMNNKRGAIISTNKEYYKRILSIDSVSTELLNGKEIYLGDLQVSFKQINDLLKECNKPDTNFNYILFTPRFDSISKRLHYEISVSPTRLPKARTQTHDLNPSPPYSADQQQ